MTKHWMFEKGGVPALPYGGTAGHAGTELSRRRAEREAEEGVAEYRQRMVLGMLEAAGPMGVTVVDARNAGYGHHGQMSSALSALHKNEVIARLRKPTVEEIAKNPGLLDAMVERDGSSIYVLPQYTEGRPVAKQGRKSSDKRVQALQEEIEALTAALTQETNARQRSEETLANAVLSGEFEVIMAPDLSTQQIDEQVLRTALDNEREEVTRLRERLREMTGEIHLLTDQHQDAERRAAENGEALEKANVIVRRLVNEVNAYQVRGGRPPLTQAEVGLVDYVGKAVAKIEGWPADRSIRIRVDTLRAMYLAIKGG